MSPKHLRRISIEVPLLLFALALYFHFLTIQHFGGDAFWHLFTGLRMLATGRVPTTDPYSWTMHGHNWVAQEWGYELLLALAYQAARFQGLFLLSLGFALALFLTLLALWRLRGASYAQAGIILMLMAYPLAPFIRFRPQEASYLLFALFLLLMELRRRGTPLGRLAPFFLLGMLLWVNVHGSFPLGIGLLLLEGMVMLLPRAIGRIPNPLAGSRAEAFPVLLLALGTGLIALINPRGPELFHFVFRVSSSPLLRNNIQEWQSPNFHEPFNVIALALPLLLLFLWVAVRREAPPLFETVLLLGCLFETLSSQRFLAYLAIAVGYYVTGVGLRPFRGPFPAHPVLHALLSAILLAYMALSWPQGLLLRQHYVADIPVQAVALLKKLPRGRIFNNYSWGGYLIWSGFPDYIDGRADMYIQGPYFQQYLRIMAMTVNPLPSFRKERVDYVLIPPQSPLAVFLDSRPGWVSLVKTRGYQLFSRLPLPSGQRGT